jgi:hypothetical protein
VIAVGVLMVVGLGAQKDAGGPRASEVKWPCAIEFRDGATDIVHSDRKTVTADSTGL